MDTRNVRPWVQAPVDLVMLKARLAGQAERLVIALLGEPTAKGARYWRWGNRGSFSYDFERQHWHCFETDQGGDLLDLIRHSNPGWNFRHALDWACNWIGRPDSHAVRPLRRHRARREAATSAALAAQLWSEARPAERTIVETYLRQRGLTLPPNSEEVLRFHPACPRGEARLPAMLGLMRDIDTDRPAGIHRTYLRSDGMTKAEVEPNKMMLGAARGAVLKLTPDEDVTLGLGLTEGIEDGLAVLNSGVAPVWVCLSAGAMLAFPVVGGVEALTVFCDADAPGILAADSCAERWRRRGKEARVVDPPPQFKDFGAKAKEERRHG